MCFSISMVNVLLVRSFLKYEKTIRFLHSQFKKLSFRIGVATVDANQGFTYKCLSLVYTICLEYVIHILKHSQDFADVWICCSSILPGHTEEQLDVPVFEMLLDIETKRRMLNIYGFTWIGVNGGFDIKNAITHNDK